MLGRMPRWKTFSMSTTFFSRKESAALFSFWLEILTDLWKTWQHLGENLKSIGIFRGCLGKPVSEGLEVLRFQRFWRVKALVGVTSLSNNFGKVLEGGFGAGQKLSSLGNFTLWHSMRWLKWKISAWISRVLPVESLSFESLSLFAHAKARRFVFFFDMDGFMWRSDAKEL